MVAKQKISNIFLHYQRKLRRYIDDNKQQLSEEQFAYVPVNKKYIFDQIEDGTQILTFHKVYEAWMSTKSLVELLEDADEKWDECKPDDWLEAFDQHPVIGDINSLKEKFYATADWAQVEQSGADEGSQELLDSLAEGNKKYQQKFGFIFIVYATGKSAEEMLAILQDRLENAPEDEIEIAAAEQIRITKNSLEKLFL